MNRSRKIALFVVAPFCALTVFARDVDVVVGAPDAYRTTESQGNPQATAPKARPGVQAKEAQ